MSEKSQTAGYFDLIREQGALLAGAKSDDDLPIDAEWLLTLPGTRRGMAPVFNHGVFIRNIGAWTEREGFVVNGLATTIKTRGELKAFLAFFGEA